MPFLPGRLNARIILVVSCILLVTGVTSGWFTARRQTAGLLAVMRTNASLMAENFAESCAHYLLVQDYADLESFLLKSAELSDIRRLQVCEPDGSLIWDVERVPSGEPRATAHIARLTPPSSRAAVVATENDRLIIWQPVMAGSLLGWLRADFSLSAIRRTQAEAWMSTLFLTMTWVACSAVLIIMVLRPIVRAIGGLTDFATQLDERKGAQIDVGSQPFEISELGRSLNEASARLLSTERQLLGERERLRKREEEFRSLAENSPDNIARHDAQCRLVYFNPSLAGSVAIDFEEIIGKSPLEASPDGDASIRRYEEMLRRTLESGEPGELEIDMPHPSGELHVHQILFVAERDPKDDVTGVLTIGRDITDRKRMEEDIRTLNEELELRVKERTAELVEKNRELERMNRLFVGRELRMIELKETVKELEKRVSGLPTVAPDEASVVSDSGRGGGS